MKKKRPVGSPSGSTPGKPSSKIARECNKSKKSLSFGCPDEFSENSSVKTSWADNEIKALVQYIALFYDPAGERSDWAEKPWPNTKARSFWDSCAEAVAEYAGLPLRSGSACRSIVTKKLRVDFKSVDDAEEKLGISYFGDENLKASDSTLPVESPSPLIHASPVRNPVPKKILPGNFLESVTLQFKKLSANQRLQLLAHLYEEVAVKDMSSELQWFIPKDFVKLSLCGMQNLQSRGKKNTIYHLSKCVGELRPDGTTRMPIMRMPFGLISYNCEFFARDDVNNLHASKDYLQWVETMYAHFGNKWACLHNGPMWSYDNVEDDSAECNNAEDDIGEGGTASNEVVVISDGVEGRQPLVQTPVGNSHESSSSDIISQAMLSAFGDDCLPTSGGDEPVTNRSVSLIWSSSSKENIPEYREEASVSQALANQERVGVSSLHVQPKRVALKRNPLTAKVNVAGPSARTIRRHIEDSGFSRETDIQFLALTAAQKSNVNGRWWIKADGTDMQMGLRESMKNEWSGDCDLGDGSLQERMRKYHERLQFVQCIGVKERKESHIISQDLDLEGARLLDEKEFLQSELKKAETVYKRKRKQTNLSEESLFALAWDVEEYETLITKNAEIRKLIAEVKEMLHVPTPEQQGNLARALRQLRDDLKAYVKNVTMKKREAASHLLIFMISDEQRAMKPYAIPVRVLPYKSITDAGIRKLRDELREAMQAIGMVVVGFSTDGEFNSLRTRGSERPVSVVQLKADAVSEARSTSVRLIEKLLFPVVGPDNSITTRAHHDAVPHEDVIWLHEFMRDNNVPFERAIHILRRTHFPFHYNPHPWIPGSDETKNDCLKSLMATYLFRAKIAQYVTLGINFKQHLYVPEVDATGVDFYEREDHNHLLKRIAACTRNGSVPGINLRYFTEALNDPATGLTYTALTGQHKQSVPDAERLLSPAMAKFMAKRGYTEEARFIQVVSNWHKASDGRGLSEVQRKQYNLDMLNYILEDWIPWCAHQEQRDYSTLDVNRPIKGIRGFTREVIVALIANIESQEKRRAECETKGLPPEHPRASSTDDVEGFIATLHQMIGVHFDHKTFRENNRKITQEFTKRVDPDLPFFYWTGVNERFHCGKLKSFNVSSQSGTERLDRVTISRRADPGVFVAGRATLPQRGTLTVRAQFHATPEQLPPRDIATAK